ncbi:MAG: DUF5050 domain-containing protein [Clostridiales bacterium]|jgi:hypothetical protein|nr:DUF5050 domain-containing protein [Clostridiales bacterium]
MRKNFIAIFCLFVILSFYFTGCGKKPSTNILNTPGPEVTFSPSPTQAAASPTPVPITTVENASNKRAVLYGDRIYYCYGGIHSIKIDGSDDKLLHTDTSTANEIYVVDDRIFYNNSYNMCSMKTDGSEWREFIGYRLQGTGTSETDSNIIFYSTESGFYSMDSDGSNIKMLSNKNIVSAFEVNNQIYCTGLEADFTKKIYSMNPDGSDIQEVNDNSTLSAIIMNGISTIVGGRIYYINDKLYSIKPDGSDIQKVSNNIDAYTSFAVTENYIYYSNENDEDKLYRMKLDGSDNKKLVDHGVSFIDIANSRIFYVNSDDSKLYITDINGNDPWVLDTTITYETTARLQEDMPEYRFVVDSICYPGHGLITGLHVYNENGAIMLSEDFTDIPSGGSRIPHNAIDTMGLYFEDMNFDGYNDVLLPYVIDRNSSYYCWLWNPNTSSLIAAESFLQIENPDVDKEDQCILSEGNSGAISHPFYIYKVINGEFVLTNYLCISSTFYDWSFEEQRLIDGKMETIRDDTIENCWMDSIDAYESAIAAAGYTNDDIWQLDSPRWSLQ